MPNDFNEFRFPPNLLPADLPENWENGQIVSPSGVSAGLTKQHGYNYLNEQVNDAQGTINALRKAQLDDLYFFWGGPFQAKNLEYTGEEQSPTWFGYDPAFLEIEGDLSAVNAGTYEVTFTPKNGYQWPDGASDPIAVNWIIEKAVTEIELDKTTLTIVAEGAADTITVTHTGTGAVVATTQSNVLSVSVNGDEVTISGKSAGIGIVSIHVRADNNHKISKAKNVTVKVNAPIYGASWDGTSTTKWTRIDAAANFDDPVPYVAGATEYGSPFDNIRPWAGMVKSERTAGTMVAIPKFYYALTQLDGGGMKIQISKDSFPGSYVSPAHMDRGDGVGERSIVYVGRYHCGDDWKSTTGVYPKTRISRSDARTQIHNIGSSIWQFDFAMLFTIWLLYIVEFADWNSQEVIGYGCGDGTVGIMGYTDDMPYHTGTTQNSRNEYGLGTQYRYIEGLWDNVHDWCDGCYNNAFGFNIIKNPNDFSDTSGGTLAIAPTYLRGGFPSAFEITDKAGFPIFYAKNNSGGSEETYSCDFWYFLLTLPCIFVGGGYTHSFNNGLFFFSCDDIDNRTSAISARLMELY